MLNDFIVTEAMMDTLRRKYLGPSSDRPGVVEVQQRLFRHPTLSQFKRITVTLDGKSIAHQG